MLIRISDFLKEHKLKLVTAESCTAGLLAYTLTSLPGSSEWFERGFITYSNQSKEEMLQVSSHTLNQQGAVSEASAREMAEGAIKNSQAQISIAITGIAGPSGGTKEKPVGMVWFAFSNVNHKTFSIMKMLDGNREEIRKKACEFALEQLLEFIQKK